MDETKIKAEARLAAIEYVLAHLYKVTYQAIGVTPEIRAESHRRLTERLATTAIPGVDAAQSDLASFELQLAAERLLGVIEEIAGSAKSREQPD
jgi:hypothetical protein